MNKKETIYSEIISQLTTLSKDETDFITRLTLVVSQIKEKTNYFWVGFYLVTAEELRLGPFKGNIACSRIHFGKGVCGSAWKSKQTIIVPDVDKFPGHIACSSLSRSEIVVPLFKNGEVIAVLDIDSTELDDFDETDKIFLEKICSDLI